MSYGHSLEYYFKSKISQYVKSRVELDFSGLTISVNEGTILGNAIVHLSKDNVEKISFAKSSPKMIRGFLNQTKGMLVKLRELDLSQIEFESFIEKSTFYIELKHTLIASQIENLNLDSTNIRNCLNLLSEVAKFCRRLRILNLKNTKIWELDCSALSKIVEVSTIESLNLAQNTIFCDYAMAYAFSGKANLNYIDLYNIILNGDSDSLFDALLQKCRLTQLSIKGALLLLTTQKTFFKHFNGNSSIEILNLNNNSLNLSYHKMTNAVKHNQSLKEIILDKTGLCGMQISEFIIFAGSVQKISFKYNQLKDDSALPIFLAIKIALNLKQECY